MTSADRREGRYERRNAKRKTKRNEKIGYCDDFELVADLDNLNRAFKEARKRTYP